MIEELRKQAERCRELLNSPATTDRLDVMYYLGKAHGIELAINEIEKEEGND